MDRNDYYGAESASLNLTQVRNTIPMTPYLYSTFSSFTASLDLNKSPQRPWVVIVIGTLT